MSLTMHRASKDGVVVWQEVGDEYMGMSFFPGEFLRPKEGKITLEVGVMNDAEIYEWTVIGVQEPISDEDLEQHIQDYAKSMNLDVEVVRAQSIAAHNATGPRKVN